MSSEREHTIGLYQISLHKNKHNGLACYASIMLAYWIDIMKYKSILSNRTVSVKHTSYLKPSYDTLILATFVSMELAYIHFSDFTKSYINFVNTWIQICLLMHIKFGIL